MKKKLLLFSALLTFGGGLYSRAQYCAAGPSSTFDSNIEAVDVTGESSTSISYTGCPGVTDVEDQTTLSVDFLPGQTYSVDVTFGTCGGNYGGAGEAWIDFNGDQVYDPATESIGTSSGTPGTAPWNAPVTFTINVPAGAPIGSTRMRVMQEEGGTLPLDPCGTFTWGSVVDFTVNIVPDAPPNPTQAAGSPDCITGSDLTLAGTPPAGIEWYWQGTNPNGTSTADVGTAPYTVYTNGTYYARAYDPVEDVWSPSSSITVTNFSLPAAPPTPTAAENPACELNGGTTISVAAAPAGEEYYWQGTNSTGTSSSDPATAPYPVPTGDTYYVASYDPVTQCWSPTSSVTVNMSNSIPNAPTPTDSVRYECSGSASILLEATATPSQSFTYTINMFDSWGDGWNGNTVDIFADGALIATVGSSFTNGSNASETFTISEGVELTTSPAQGGNFTNECTYDILDQNSNVIGSGSGNGGITPYNVPTGTYTIDWYDAASGGNLLGSGSTFEAVGSSVMPTAAVGSYTFYIEQSNGCESATRDSVVVEVSNVNVLVAGIDVNCNGSASGSFELTDTLCGVTPFQYSVDGGAYGPIPTDLLPGQYDLVVQDDNGDQSGLYTFTVNDVVGPQNVMINYTTSDGGEVAWTPGASETQWIVEWGAPGFSPGTGTEIGSTTVTDTFAIMTGLMPDTEYDVYVAADCGSGSINDWGMASFFTDCIVLSAPIIEDYDDTTWVSGTGFGNVDDTLNRCWRRNPGNGNFFWGVRTGATGSSSTGPSSDVSGNGNYLYTEGSNGLTGDSAYVYSEKIDLSTVTDPYLTFSYHMFGGDIDSLTVYVSNDNGFSWDTIGHIYGQQQTASTDAWKDTSLSLSAYANDTVSVSFLNTRGGGFESDVAIDEFSILPCIGDAGEDGSTDVCRLDSMVNLNNSITINQTLGGRWEFPLDQSLIVNDTMMNVLLLPADAYEVYYIVPGACQEDTAVATINVFPPSSAGSNGSLTVCLNEPINLYDGLGGNVDLGGDWYDPSNDLLPNSQPTASNIPGNYNFDYITSNGVCPADTALVEVIVNGECDWLSIGEEAMNEISVYPNPATNVINIVNPANTSALKVEIFDVNGRLVASDDKALENSTEGSIAIDHLETGIYTLRVYGENGQKAFKIVKR